MKLKFVAFSAADQMPVPAPEPVTFEFPDHFKPHIDLAILKRTIRNLLDVDCVETLEEYNRAVKKQNDYFREIEEDENL